MLGFVIRFHMKFHRGISTIETMVMMLAVGLVILAVVLVAMVGVMVIMLVGVAVD